MEQNENTNEQNTEQKQDKPTASWKEMFLLYVAIGIVVVFAVFVVRAMDRAEVKPSEILTNEGSNSLLNMEDW